MNNDYSYCNPKNCIKSKECKRFIGNHILQFVPNKWIEFKSCIKNDYSAFVELKESK